MAATADELVIRLLTPEGRADPYPVYRAIAAHARILKWQDAWFLMRHADVSMVRDPRFKIRPPEPTPYSPSSSWEQVSSKFVLFLDPPDHERIRSLVTSAFSPRAVGDLRPRIMSTCSDLIDEMEPSGSADMLADFAYQLPVTVICELLDLPSEHRDQFRMWSRDLAPAFDGGDRLTMERADQAVEGMLECLVPIVAARRQRPGSDLLSAMIHTDRHAGAGLVDDELLANTILLFFGGHETTVNLIGNGLLALLRQREQWEDLIRTPSLARQAVEELLRYDAPVQLTGRFAHEDIDIGGYRIQRGDKVQFVLGAANRDGEVFDEPDRLVITRPNASKHVSFGAGIHYCVGAALARLEAEVALSQLANRLPRLRLPTDDVQWRPTYILRGLVALPVEF